MKAFVLAMVICAVFVVILEIGTPKILSAIKWIKNKVKEIRDNAERK